MPLRENPQPSDFQTRVDHLKSLKTEAPAGYSNAIKQLKNIINGSDTEGIKAKYYAEWENEDIEDLLTELGEATN